MAALVLVGAMAILSILAWRWLRGIGRISAVLARMAPALLEQEEFFALLDLAGHESKFLERHGPMLQAREVLQRAETGGLDISGFIGPPVASARWFRHADLLKAVLSAAKHWKAGARPKGGRFLFEFDRAMGEGFRKGGGEMVKTCNAIVVIRHGEVVTAYPSLADTSGRVIPAEPMTSEILAVPNLRSQSSVLLGPSSSYGGAAIRAIPWEFTSASK